jgi:hypothetical protein
MNEMDKQNILKESDSPSVTTPTGTKGLILVTAGYDFSDVPFVPNLRPFEIFPTVKPPVRMAF